MPTYVLNEPKMFSDIADEIAIVINVETGIYYGMNAFGSAVFQNLLNGASEEAITRALATQPSAPDDLSQRVKCFISNLVDFDIIKEGLSSEYEAVFNAGIGEEDEFILSVEEFSDAQEMLLADPIHDVKASSGWEPDKKSLETE